MGLKAAATPLALLLQQLQPPAAPAPQASIAPGTTAASVLTGELRNQIDRIWDAF